MNTFYKVTSRFYDNGNVESTVGEEYSIVKPDNVYKELNEYDYYVDYFDTLVEAENFKAEVKYI